MYEYQSMRLDDQNSRYYCMLCDKAIETADIAQHSTSYMHLFRYVVRRPEILHFKPLAQLVT